jgi:uncharacterized protein (UPF0276 family)
VALRHAGVGLGLRWAFIDAVAAGDAPTSVAFFEVGPENYMRRGGWIADVLPRVAERHDLLPHGLMMNLGGPQDIDAEYLRQLRRFLDRIDAPFHSDHLCWSGTDGAILHDLLPLPTHRRMVTHCADRIRRVQDRLGRPMAIENVSYYLSPGGGAAQQDFLLEVLQRADCRLLLDVNNLAVNADNHGFDAFEALAQIPLQRVAQLHVAGGERLPDHDGLVIDTHGADVSPRVEQMMAWVIRRTGPLPVVYERDHAIPPLAELGRQVARLQAVYDEALGAHDATAPGADDERPARDAPRDEGDPFALQRGLQAVIVRPDLGALYERPEAWLRDRGLPAGDAQTLAVLGAPRLAVVRTLVRRSLRAVIEAFIPRTVARLGPAAFDAAFDAWLDQAPPTSRYYREVPGAFVAWAAAHWTDHADVPAYLSELAAFEVVEAEVEAAAPRESTTAAPALALDRPLRFDPAVRLQRHAHAVHELPASLRDRTVPAATETRLLRYRDADGDVRSLALSPVAYEVLLRLVEHTLPLADALRQGAAAADEPLDDTLLARLSALLTDLATRGVVLGAC